MLSTILAIIGVLLIIIMVISIVGAITFVCILIFKGLPGAGKPGWRYRRQARILNERARKMRVARTDWEGWPLPTGKKGRLVITEAQQIALPGMSEYAFREIMTNRARDLGVEVNIERNIVDNAIIVQWRPEKKRKK